MQRIVACISSFETVIILSKKKKKKAGKKNEMKNTAISDFVRNPPNHIRKHHKRVSMAKFAARIYSSTAFFLFFFFTHSLRTWRLAVMAYYIKVSNRMQNIFSVNRRFWVWQCSKHEHNNTLWCMLYLNIGEKKKVKKKRKKTLMGFLPIWNNTAEARSSINNI